MKRKKGLLILCLFVILGIVTFFLYNSKEVLEEVKSLIAIQRELEKEFKIEGYTFDNPNVILDPYDNSPLTALIIFETEEEVSPIVTIKGKDVQTTYTQEFENSKEHYLPILGLYTDSENEIILEVNGESKSIIIETEELPEHVVLAEYVYSDKAMLEDELYFFTPSSDGPVSAYDVNGDLRWYLTNTGTWKIEKLDNGNMLLSTERIVNPPYFTTGLYEIDMLGKIHNEYTLEGGYHHDYFELDNGNLIVLSSDFDTGTVEDVIVEIDRTTGDIVKSIDLKNILNMTDGKSEDWIDYDWFHNNSVWYDEESNSLTLSGRHQDAVININYDTEELNWIIGDSTNWSDEYQKYFFTPIGDNFEWQWAQHAAMITPEGYVFILDNGNNKSKIESEYVPAEESYTRGVMYDINTDDMTIRQVWQYGKERGSEFYSPYISDVDYLNSNHYIVHSGGIVYVDGKVANSPAGLINSDKLVSNTVEILNDKVIFEIKLPTNNYRVEKMDLYDNFVFELGNANSYGTLGETNFDESRIGFVFDAQSIDEDYTNKKIELTKEIDRLVVNGIFTREDEVKVILSKLGQIKEYDVVISTRPYTALCVDIFTEEDLSVTKYINEDGLDGKYNLYIELNGKIYDTEKAISFN